MKSARSQPGFAATPASVDAEPSAPSTSKSFLVETTMSESERQYADPLKTALARSGGADETSLAGWAENMRRANVALDVPIADLVRAGNCAGAQELSNHGEGLEACADFLDRLYEEMENPRAD
jgi:hypothetical protein